MDVSMKDPDEIFTKTPIFVGVCTPHVFGENRLRNSSDGVRFLARSFRYLACSNNGVYGAEHAQKYGMVYRMYILHTCLSCEHAL